MVIDVISERNVSAFYDFSVTVMKFQAIFLHCVKKILPNFF